jgi:RNA polymerase sigma-70 factor, ECF subfamily
VQEAFTRFLERPPAKSQPAHAWLVRVTMNLALDALRARRRRAYAGPWLPTPVEREERWLELAAAPDASARYELRESATYSFLVALEVLRPRERAVLLLRDVLGWNAAESASLLGISEGNARVIHLRARRALSTYDRARCIPSPELWARHREALEQLLAALLAQDTQAVESLLASSVRTATDSGGEYTALAQPLFGRQRVARFYLQAARMRLEGEPQVEVRGVNGLPAAVITLRKPVRNQAPRSLLCLELDESGGIGAILSVLASAKLSTVSFPS